MLTQAMNTLAQDEDERCAAQESEQKAEARCAVLQESTDRLEGDLARLSAQVKTKHLPLWR